MGFWIFMLIMDLLIPFTMIGFGKMFLKKIFKNNSSTSYHLPLVLNRCKIMP